jgi:hypothetical protein
MHCLFHVFIVCHQKIKLSHGDEIHIVYQKDNPDLSECHFISVDSSIKFQQQDSMFSCQINFHVFYTATRSEIDI